MARLYKVDGSVHEITPANGVNWSLEELQVLVGGYIEVLRTRQGHFLVVDEEGLLKKKYPNRAATELYQYGDSFVIVGDALVVETLYEMEGPPDPEEDA